MLKSPIEKKVQPACKLTVLHVTHESLSETEIFVLIKKLAMLSYDLDRELS